MVKRLAIALGLALAVLLLAPTGVVGSPAHPPTEGDEPVVVLLFHGDGCPYCATAREFLDELAERHPDLEVRQFEVWNDSGNRELLRRTAAEHGFEASAVPVIFVGDRSWVGFNDAIGDEIEAVVAALLGGEAAPEPGDAASTVDVPFVGDVDVGDRSLVLATVLIAFVDGVNPCSLWVLSILLALVLHSGSRGRVLAVGSVFLLITSALYGLYMVGAYSALDYAGEARWIRVAVALVAGTFGVLHLKEYVTARGPSVSIPAERKPGLYRRMRALADVDRSLPTVLGGTVLLAAGVSLLETPCTAGLPLLWTDLLAAQDVSSAGAALLFALYLGVFLLDELVIFAAAVVTLRATKLQEQHGRVLQLASGTLMVTLAAAMVAAPRALESIAGTVAVFGGAAAVVVVVVAADRRWPHRLHGAPQGR